MTERTTRDLETEDEPTRTRPASNRRQALVLGNSQYTSSRLANPASDAALIAEALRVVGFEVTEVTELGRRDMMRAIQSFTEQLAMHGGVGLFYYAGHGVQVDGNNYLIPVDAQIEREVDVKIEAVEMNWVLDCMEHAQARMNIVVLDACRNNPYTGSSRSIGGGLAQINAPVGSFIAYATSPGSVADDGDEGHSPYSKALAEHLRKPGLRIEDVFKAVRVDVRQDTEGHQTPWESSSLEGDFYFSNDQREIKTARLTAISSSSTIEARGIEPANTASSPLFAGLVAIFSGGLGIVLTLIVCAALFVGLILWLHNLPDEPEFNPALKKPPAKVQPADP